MKKILALVIAALMIVASMAALADVPTSQTIADGNAPDATTGKYTISVASTDTHTYTVYQVLTGTLIAGENKLGNPVWGQDASAAAKAGTAKDFIDQITSLTGVTLAEAVAAKVDTSTNRGTVDKDNPLDVVPGYYLIVDTTTNLAAGDSKSLNIVAVFNDITITPKKGTTTSEKKVDDKNDSNTTEDAVVWNDSADYDIGDDVPFQLKATIAEDYDNYTHGYKLTFHDEQSAGLSFKANTVEVFVDGVKISDGYEVVTTGLTAPETFQIKFANLKNIASVHAGSVITVTYKSTLTGEAVVIGKPGNPNESYVTYSNNPNDDQAGENGQTPKDKVVVFTFMLDVDKIDAVFDPLEGAGFTLYKWDASKEGEDKYVQVGEEQYAESGKTNFLWKGIDDGKYKIVETHTPEGYNTMDPIEFVVYAEHELEDADPELTKLEAKKADGSGLSDDVAASLNAGKLTKKKGTEKDTVSGEVYGELINRQGNTLPSTGGIGTTLFYVGGGILVVLAGILLVTKRRMKAED